jgi:hypothetical protein
VVAPVLVAAGFALAAVFCGAMALHPLDQAGPHWLLPVVGVGALCLTAGFGLALRDYKAYAPLLDPHARLQRVTNDDDTPTA